MSLHNRNMIMFQVSTQLHMQIFCWMTSTLCVLRLMLQLDWVYFLRIGSSVSSLILEFILKDRQFFYDTRHFKFIRPLYSLLLCLEAYVFNWNLIFILSKIRHIISEDQWSVQNKNYRCLKTCLLVFYFTGICRSKRKVSDVHWEN